MAEAHVGHWWASDSVRHLASSRAARWSWWRSSEGTVFCWSSLFPARRREASGRQSKVQSWQRKAAYLLLIYQVQANVETRLKGSFTLERIPQWTFAFPQTDRNFLSLHWCSPLRFWSDLWLVWTSLNLHGRERQYSDGQSCLISVILLIIFGPLILPVNCSLLLTNTCFLPFFLFSLSLSFSSVWPDWVIILPIWATLERPKSNNFLAIFENGANLSIFKCQFLGNFFF